jgi:hypothetical protein
MGCMRRLTRMAMVTGSSESGVLKNTNDFINALQ